MDLPKRKNTENKQVEKPSPKGCLAQYLAMNTMGTGFIALISFSMIYAALRDYPDELAGVQIQLMAYVAISILMFVCAIGLTCWKHWAFTGH